MSSYAQKAYSIHDERVAALLDLCRMGVLRLGLRGGEATYQVTPEFGRELKECHRVLLLAAGYGVDPVGEVAMLALISWCDERGSLLERDAPILFEALSAVIQCAEAP